MKTLDELYTESDYFDKEHRRVLNEIFHHPDFIKQHFKKLKLNDSLLYINYLIKDIGIVYSGLYQHRYTIKGKHYLMKDYNYDGHFADIIFFTGGQSESDSDENNYTEFKPNQYKRLLKILKIYFSNKLDPKILNDLLEKENLEDFVAVGFLLFLNRFIHTK
ncbi:hypothetical protein [Bacillus sp. T33-2]|uniref:hypothetical protein n=1 Tax=Bacillus sp. T33-2 TaxID=2054168 RepID=UPI000C76D64C|nr:hypothetical protein [Bacillus sp. T33-2]PLR99606.1 hypothetical protein CVD19_00655 [Bacillus sp. T33-2]